MLGVKNGAQSSNSVLPERLIGALNLCSSEDQTIEAQTLVDFIQSACATNKIDTQQRDELISRLSQLNKLSIDSRKANKDCVFMALLSNTTLAESGTVSVSANDGHQYIQKAIKASCPLILSDCHGPSEHLQIELVSDDFNDHLALQISMFNLRKNAGQLAKAFYFGYVEKTKSGKHSEPVLPTVTAITGTNGKTSVASLFAQWVSLLGTASASVGTLGVNLYEGGRSNCLHETINTTPDVVSMFGYLAQLSQAGSQHIAIEASSHGLMQKRLQDLDVACGVFTNLSQDHLDYHKTMDEYGTAKRLLLRAPNLRHIVLNSDDPQSQLWTQDLNTIEAHPEIEAVYFSLQSAAETSSSDNAIEAIKRKGRYCIARNLLYTNKGCEFDFVSSWGNQSICLPLIGQFNVANFLAVAAALLVQSFDFVALMAQVKNLSGVSGRMELFDSKTVHVDMLQKNASKKQNSTQKYAEISHNKANILVDYAHTPDALRQALLAAKRHTRGRLICVFGCGGDRDKSKRSQMGAIANEYADTIVLTQDNSRTEEPSKIIADILQGIAKQHKVSVELDRKQAIKDIWLTSRAEDLIVLAGKGHETYMEINNQRIPYDERAFVDAMFKEHMLKTIAHEGASI